MLSCVKHAHSPCWARQNLHSLTSGPALATFSWQFVAPLVVRLLCTFGLAFSAPILLLGPLIRTLAATAMKVVVLLWIGFLGIHPLHSCFHISCHLLRHGYLLGDSGFSVTHHITGARSMRFRPMRL